MMLAVPVVLAVLSAEPADFSPPPLINAPVEDVELPAPPPPPPLTPKPDALEAAPVAVTSTPHAAGFEYGRATAELLVGTALSAGLTLFPYYLALKPMVEGASAPFGSPALGTTLFSSVFLLVPIAVTRTQTAIANGSSDFQVDNWVPAIAGVAAEGLVMSAFFVSRAWRPIGDTTETGTATAGNQAWLLVGSVFLVPLVTTVLINLMKSAKQRLL
jgi:hypothetical protein